MPETRKVEIRKQIRLFDDFFKVDEITLRLPVRHFLASSRVSRMMASSAVSPGSIIPATARKWRTGSRSVAQTAQSAARLARAPSANCLTPTAYAAAMNFSASPGSAS
jgi:hypothetical protein